jgi:4-amino-4-deoxy-L-arabinose transferase-like glycosyltransferase
MHRSAAPADASQLSGRSQPWGRAGLLLLTLLVAVAAWLRLRGLSAESFADDEVHKWLAAKRYLSGDLGGDDVEHPMIMKALAALSVAALRGFLAPEALTRLPSALAGAATVLATALLGRRLFGRFAGLLGAALVALAPTAIGYHRIAKEDVLLGLFFTLSLWCLAEARAAAEDGRGPDSRRFEAWSAAAVGAAFASKYFIFYFPIPVLAYLWLRPVSAWRVPPRRWAALVGLSLAVFIALDPVVLLPSTWAYGVHYLRGDVMGSDRGVSETILFMGRLWGNLAFRGETHTPSWFFAAFAAVKFTPVVAALGFGGLAWALIRRAPAHRIVLAWVGIFVLSFVVEGAKYGRFFVSVLPAFLLLAAHAAERLAQLAASRLGPPARAPALAAAFMATAAPEASAALSHAPHHRLYVSPLFGGDARVGWWFPHCDYFDAGLREAVTWIAGHAEPGAEIASDVDWSVRLYAEAAGRTDLASTIFTQGRACPGMRPCYVIVQPGRLYRHNLAAVERLRLAAPVHVEQIRGRDAALVYRLAPGERLFP